MDLEAGCVLSTFSIKRTVRGFESEEISVDYIIYMQICVKTGAVFSAEF